MNKNVQFGIDYLFLTMIFHSDPKGQLTFNPIIEAAACFFLVNWGFESKEVDDIRNKFQKEFEKKSSTIEKSLVRIAGQIKDDTFLKEKFFTQMTALCVLDNRCSDMEADLLNVITTTLDFKPSEADTLRAQGFALASGLTFFGKAYAAYQDKYISP